MFTENFIIYVFMNKFLKIFILITCVFSIFLSQKQSLKIKKLDTKIIKKERKTYTIKNKSFEINNEKITQNKVAKKATKQAPTLNEDKLVVIENKQVIPNEKLNIESSRIIKKNIEENKIENITIASTKKILNVEKIKISNIKKTIEINVEEPLKLKKIKIQKILKTENLLVLYKPFIYKEIIPIKLAVKNAPIKKEILAENIKSNKKEETKIDIIETSMAATLKEPINEKTLIDSKSKTDELIFFDYSKAKEDISVSSKSKSISKTYSNKQTKPKKSKKKHITKRKKKKIKVPIITGNKSGPIEPDELIPFVKESGLFDNKMTTQDDYSPKKKTEYSSSNNKIYKTSFQITTQSVEINKMTSQNLDRFQLEFFDDADDSVRDFDGIIKIKNQVNSPVEVRSASIVSIGHVVTNIDLTLENEEILLNIPLVTESSYVKLTNKYNIDESLGSVLISLDDKVEDVDINADYGRRLYLDRNFKEVNSESDYLYVFFLGVEAGNAILEYVIEQNEKTTKIIFVENEEIYFDLNYLVESESEIINFYTRYVLSRKKKALEVDKEDISNFSYNSKFTKNSLNSLKQNFSVYPLGTRKYYELSRDGNSVYFGRWNNKNVVIPSENFISIVLDSFEIDSLDNQCIIQLNVKKPIKEVYSTGRTNDGYMRVNLKTLDSDGEFYNDFSTTTENIFFLGENQGVVDIKINYMDGTQDFLKSYCSNESYFVEQL